jgi:RNA polymerase sigma-70 factor (ECF subfamily)
MLDVLLHFIAEPAPTAMAIDADRALAQKASRNPQAFSELYERHVDRVYRYLLSRTGNRDDAQDLTSQTFLTALEQLPRYRGEGVFVAWLMGIARNKATDHFRNRRPETDIDESFDLPDSGEATDDLVERQLAVESVARKLKVLAPDRAEALSLRLFGGLEVAEIAPILGKNEAAVRMLVFRGLRDLQAQLNPDQESLI